jgi:hypothetical protein
MASECLDLEGEEWSDVLVQTCLPKLLDHNQCTESVQKADVGSLGMLNTSPEESQRLCEVVVPGSQDAVVKSV